MIPQARLVLPPRPGQVNVVSRSSPQSAVAAMLAAAVVLVHLAGLACPTPAGAQEVFVTRGAGSPVFSDQPQPGATPLALPPVNVVKPLPVDKAAATPPEGEARAVPALPAYRSFRILSPQDNGSVAANSAFVDVRVAVDPPLQLAAGHAVVVSINGRAVGQRFTSSEFTVPFEFWGDGLPAANQRQQLDAAIVDANGAVLEKASPVSFIPRYVDYGYRPPWHRPRPLPVPLPVERPKPPPAQPFDPWERKFEQQGLRFYPPQEQPGGRAGTR